jgi:hypothetical protein
VPTDKGAKAGLKVASLVAGMGRVFINAYAPSTLRSFRGHSPLATSANSMRSRRAFPDWAGHPGTAGRSTRSRARVLVDIDDTIIEVHGYAKQGSGYGYSGVCGLNALLATATTALPR